GSMILCELILKHFSRYIDVLSQRLGVNQYSIMGLFLQLASSVAMFPLFSKMDKKGKIINGAFSVSGAYALGAQLGFISSVADQNGVMIYLISKLVGGILAIILANYFYKEKASD
ncbi:MAG: ethanolamine utilization protein EutH, partial [Faecalibacillus sp.]